MGLSIAYCGTGGDLRVIEFPRIPVRLVPGQRCHLLLVAVPASGRAPSLARGSCLVTSGRPGLAGGGAGLGPFLPCCVPLPGALGSCWLTAS